MNDRESRRWRTAFRLRRSYPPGRRLELEILFVVFDDRRRLLTLTRNVELAPSGSANLERRRRRRRDLVSAVVVVVLPMSC